MKHSTEVEPNAMPIQMLKAHIYRQLTHILTDQNKRQYKEFM